MSIGLRALFVLLCTGLLAGACRTPIGTGSSPRSMPPSTTDSAPMNCESARQCILSLDLRTWPGLPTDCDWQDWTGPYPADWQQIYARPLGNTFRPAQQLNVKLEGYTNPHLYFFEGKAVMFEAMAGPILVAFDELLQGLGAPAARLDWDFGTLPLPAAEYVFPDRGITLFLNTEKDRALHVALYQPCTLDDYLALLRPNFAKKRLPYRR